MEILGYLYGAVAYEAQGFQAPKRQDPILQDLHPESDRGSTTTPSESASFRFGAHIHSISILTLIGALSLWLGAADHASAQLLRHADRSPAVTQLQQSLTTAGFYHGPITGYYGDLTQAAVRRFQQAQGLTVDGIAGPQTLAALQRHTPGASFSTASQTTRTSASQPAQSQAAQSQAAQSQAAQSQAAQSQSASGLSIGSTGSRVTQLQVQLTQAGVYSGPITDYFGPRTQDAVIQFQRNHGIPPTGVVDAATSARLNQVSPQTTTATTGRPFEVTSNAGRPSSSSRPSPSSAGISSFNAQGSTGTARAVGQTSPYALLYRGDSGPTVTQLQESLRRVGVYNGPITGYYGSLTEDAVFQFQRLNGVEPTGVAGPVTQQLIASSSQPI